MKTLPYLLSLVSGVLFWLTPQAYAFPEMVRHGYANCISCHVAPDGGGVLTPYGRSLSREILSGWGKEGEERFAYLLTPPEWLHLGGDVRAVQTYYNSSTKERARLIFMQADVEAAAQIEKWTVTASLGLGEPTSSNASGSNLFSRRHYVNYRPMDNLSFRIGRFNLPYGINLPDHFVSVKRGLRWDEGSESYNLEAAYLGENVTVQPACRVGEAPPCDGPRPPTEQCLRVRTLLFMMVRTSFAYLPRPFIGPSGRREFVR